MQDNKKIAAWLGVGTAALALGTFAATRPAAAQAPITPPVIVNNPAGRERHPNIRRMMQVIDRVKDNLQKDPHDFGGHRVAAIQDLTAAENELQQALASDKH